MTRRGAGRRTGQSESVRLPTMSSLSIAYILLVPVILSATAVRRAEMLPVVVGAAVVWTLLTLLGLMGYFFGTWNLRRLVLLASPAFQLWEYVIGASTFRHVAGRHPQISAFGPLPSGSDWRDGVFSTLYFSTAVCLPLIAASASA
jgi:hypothetical protein